MHEILFLLRTVPSDLLLVFKTNDCLRHLDRILHTPVNSVAGTLYFERFLVVLILFLCLVTAKVVAEVLLEENINHLRKEWHNKTLFESCIFLSNTISEWFQVMARSVVLSSLSSYLQVVESMLYFVYFSN